MKFIYQGAIVVIWDDIDEEVLDIAVHHEST